MAVTRRSRGVFRSLKAAARRWPAGSFSNIEWPLRALRRTSCGRAGRLRGSTRARLARSASAAVSRSAPSRRPEAEVWVLYGDGACGYSLAEFDTFARHGMPVIAVVGNDASWAQIARDQIEMLKDDVGTVLAPTAYHEVAEGYGGGGFEIPRDADIAAGLAEARRSRGPESRCW